VKPKLQYDFEITFNGYVYHIDVQGNNVGIASIGLPPDGHYEVLRKYLEDEGFIVAIDQERGIFDLFS
jgi:hypothetical protein